MLLQHDDHNHLLTWPFLGCSSVPAEPLWDIRQCHNHVYHNHQTTAMKLVTICFYLALSYPRTVISTDMTSKSINASHAVYWWRKVCS